MKNKIKQVIEKIGKIKKIMKNFTSKDDYDDSFEKTESIIP